MYFLWQNKKYFISTTENVLIDFAQSTSTKRKADKRTDLITNAIECKWHEESKNKLCIHFVKCLYSKNNFVWQISTITNIYDNNCHAFNE
jgi:hypothetical protein